MSTQELRESRLAVHDGIAELSHQRPATRNVMSLALRADYQDTLARLESDRSIRALIITGSGGSFCAGGDVKAMLARQAGGDPSGLSAAQLTLSRLQADHRGWLDRLRSLDVPVIAAVDGPAFGAGLSLCLMADFTLASTTASFCAVFAKIGVVPDFGLMYTLPRVVGLAKSKELMMTARRFGAEEAKALGIVYEIHEPEALLAQAHALAARLAQGPREALGMMKVTLNRSFDVDYQAMGDIEASQQALAMSMPFHADAVARFARREPLAYDWDRT